MRIVELLAEISWIETAAVVFAIAYLVLAIRQSSLCWPAALISVVLSLVLFYDARLYMETALQVFYIVMAVYGWYQWRRGGTRHTGVKITTWSARRHLISIGAILVLTFAFGVALKAYTDGAMPFLDSFTTIGAIVTTYMVAKKILENWIYWLVVDSASAYLYGARGLYLYALLYVFYLVLVVIGYRRWLEDWRHDATPAAA
ncbi:MAG TPA: nicotinamide riboside transporter PnuC [Gammaproteobacteria bacterium]